MSLSLVSLLIIFLVNKMDVSIYDYQANISNYNNLFLNDNLSYICLISSITLVLLIAIDYITNADKFDIIFIPKYSNASILASKFITYFIVAINYTMISYLCLLMVGVIRYSGFIINFKVILLYFYLLLFNIEVIVISLFLVLMFKNGFCAIISIILYFLSSIIYDSNKIIANIILFHIDAQNNMTVGFIICIVIIIILIILLMKFKLGFNLSFKKKEKAKIC